MSEETKFEALGNVNDALMAIPEQYRAEVSKSLTHDIGIIARTINMVTSEPAPECAS